jgi:hypothetical protein
MPPPNLGPRGHLCHQHMKKSLVIQRSLIQTQTIHPLHSNAEQLFTCNFSIVGPFKYFHCFWLLGRRKFVINETNNNWAKCTATQLLQIAPRRTVLQVLPVMAKYEIIFAAILLFIGSGKKIKFNWAGYPIYWKLWLKSAPGRNRVSSLRAGHMMGADPDETSSIACGRRGSKESKGSTRRRVQF